MHSFNIHIVFSVINISCSRALLILRYRVHIDFREYDIVLVAFKIILISCSPAWDMVLVINNVHSIDIDIVFADGA